MSRLLKGNLCLLGVGLAGAIAMFANHQMQSWPEKPRLGSAPQAEYEEFPQTRAALDAGCDMGMALKWRPQSPGLLYLTQAEQIERVNRWLEQMAEKRSAPRMLRLTAAQPEGYVMIDYIGFD